METNRIYHGDCLKVMAEFPDNSIDAIACDPPYGLEFMGKEWDRLWTKRDPHKDSSMGRKNDPYIGARVEKYVGGEMAQAWHLRWATEALRIAKPGAHLLAFGGTRTHHRLWCAIEDAGWEIRDCIMWVYASGFPKSHDVSKAIDKTAGVEREVVGVSEYATRRPKDSIATFCMKDGRAFPPPHTNNITAPATDAARRWQGWGTALKPAWEPICVARKPLEGTVAENVLKYGTGAMNIDGCRVGKHEATLTEWQAKGLARITGNAYGKHKPSATPLPQGRWPANLIHDGSEEVVRGFPEVHGAGKIRSAIRPAGGFLGGVPNDRSQYVNESGIHSAARFFYCAKASRKERNMGCEDIKEIESPKQGGAPIGRITSIEKRGGNIKMANTNPCVKPLKLMRYLCRLVTPPGGIVLDPFAGSGSTCVAAKQEGFRYIGIEQNEHDVQIAELRISHILI